MRVRDARRGGILFGLLLSALAMVCVVVAVAIYFTRNATVTTRDIPGGTDVSVETPGGHISVRAHDRSGTPVSGVPIYPGARPGKRSGGDAVVEWTSNGDGGDKDFAVSASEMVTDDPVDQVADYYRKQLPDWIVEKKRDGSIRLELHEGGYKRIVAIHEKDGRTHIGVASVGEPASN